MSSRQEEKERRRQERLEREQAEAKKAQSRRRLQLVGGAVLGLAAIVAVVLAIASGGGDDDMTASGNTKSDAADVKLPARQIADFDEAVAAAGCEAKTYPSEGREHLTSDTGTFDKYKTNPPTSGTHRPTAAEEGIYESGDEPDAENWVHSLEHGRVIFQYKPGTPKPTVDQLESLLNERVKGVEGYHTMLIQNNTEMEAPVAAVAWTQSMTCPEMNDKVFDALRAFRERYVDKGPELIP